MGVGSVSLVDRRFRSVPRLDMRTGLGGSSSEKLVFLAKFVSR